MFLFEHKVVERQSRTDPTRHHSSHTKTQKGEGKCVNYFLLALRAILTKRRTPHRPLSERIPEAEKERTRDKTYLVEGDVAGFQLFHDIPVIRSSQVQISARKGDPLQQDIQQFRDIVSPNIQNDSRQRRGEGSRTPRSQKRFDSCRSNNANSI